MSSKRGLDGDPIWGGTAQGTGDKVEQRSLDNKEGLFFIVVVEDLQRSAVKQSPKGRKKTREIY